MHGFVPKWWAGGEGDEEKCGKLIGKHGLADSIGRKARWQLSVERDGVADWRWESRSSIGNFFYLNWLTVFGSLDLGALMLPNDGWWWGTGHIADDVSVIAFVELLRAGSTLKRDLFCVKIWHIHTNYACLGISWLVCIRNRCMGRTSCPPTHLHAQHYQNRRGPTRKVSGC